MLFTISPGLVARSPGMFSTAGVMPTTLIGKRMVATASSVPSTLPAPLISNFISSISAPGLSDIPPVSKVTPLPTSTTGFCEAGPPRYSSTISLGGSRLPALTDSNEPMPSFCMSARSSTFTLSLWRLASARAVLARCVGVHTLPGRLPKSLARFMPRPSAEPCVRPRFAAAASLPPCASVSRRSADV